MDVERYLRTVDHHGGREVNATTLAALQRAHLMAVPFEALDCLLGNPVTVEPEDAYRKVVERRRGGYCFELNGLFGRLLEELGFPVQLLAARPTMSDGNLAEPFAHLALLVEVDERRWLVDVGFGAPFALAPLDVDSDADQGGYRVAPDGDGLVAEEIGAAEHNGYRFSLEPVERQAFAERCRIYSTDPESPFVRRAPVQQHFENGWASMTRTQIRGVRGGVALDREITDEADWHELLRHHFGLEIDGREVRRVDA